MTTAVVAGRAHSFIEGAQAGLSWSTILKKRDAYRAAFDGFNPALVAAYDGARVAELLANPDIVRNRVEVPAETIESRAMSKDLQRRSFNFVGPTICYAFMQAVGMV